MRKGQLEDAPLLLFDENLARMLLSFSLFEVELLPIQESKSTNFLARILSGHPRHEEVECLSCWMKNAVPLFLNLG